jgi:hypothetical protein
MKRILFSVAAAFSLALAGCGGGSNEQRVSGAALQPCAVLADASDVFKRPTTSISYADRDYALSCQYASDDGLVDASFVTFDDGGGARFQTETDDWKKDFYGEAADLPGLGDQALIVTHMTGGQTQIAVRKGEKLALIQVSSGDPARDAETSAKAFADALVAAWP